MHLLTALALTVTARLATARTHLTHRVHAALDRHQQRTNLHPADAGLGTLEMVVLAVGLFTVAGVLVAAITAAINQKLPGIR